MKHFFLFQEIKFYRSYQKVIKNGAFNFSAYKIFFKVNKFTQYSTKITTVSFSIVFIHQNYLLAKP